MIRSHRRLKACLNNMLIGLVIVLGTSVVSAMDRIERLTPGMSVYERVLMLLPCGH